MSRASISEISDIFTRGQKIFLTFLLVIAVAFGLLAPQLLNSNAMKRIVLTKEYEPGELADEDIISPEDYSFVDEIATDQARSMASSSVLPIFSCSLQDTIWNGAIAEEFVTAFDLGGEYYDRVSDKYNDLYFDALYSEYQTIDEEDRKSALLLTRDFVRYALNQGVFSDNDITRLRNEGYSYVNVEYYRDGKIERSNNAKLLSDLISDKFLYDAFLEWLSRYEIKYSPAFIKFVFNAVNTILVPNYFYDKAYTDIERARVASEVNDINIDIKKGDYILKTDTLVTEQQLRVIDRINSVKVSYSFSELIGRVLILSVCTSICLIYFIVMTERRYRIVAFSFAFLISFVFVLALSYLMQSLVRYINVNSIRDQAMPFLFMPLLIMHLTNKRQFGLISGLLYSFYMMFLTDNNIFTLCYIFSMIVVGIMLVKFGVNRIDMIFQTFYTALFCSILTMIFHLMNHNPINMLLAEILTVFLNVTITYVFIAIILPIIEHITNIPTVFRLHELCTTDSPILQRMRIAAPGTYNHVNNVADMAYEAIKEIGGNAELAKVGGLYHDIGKIEHPEYFVENQPKDSHNVHDDLKSSLSAAVLKSHVKLGVEKGKEIGLPQEVIDIIYQHHGNDIIQYFYNEAKKEVDQNKNPYGVNEDDFRYNADPPQTREAAAVMLADCFEAASRTLDKPTRQRYENFFNSILVGKITRSQLNDCGLTMNDLNTIKRVFIHEAIARDHHRIKYDNDKSEKKE